MSFKLRVSQGTVYLKNNEFSLTIDGNISPTGGTHIAEEFLGGEDLRIFKQILEAFPNIGEYTIEYFDAPKIGASGSRE